MERVTDLYPECLHYRTRVWITDKGRSELYLVTPATGAKMEVMAEKGFYRSPTLHEEGGGAWAFGSSDTVRIAGYFPSEPDLHIFVIGGVYKGKRGSGSKRKGRGNTVVDRVLGLKKSGVIYVQPNTKAPE